jgi:type VI secretion system ImpA family protein
MQKPPVVFQFEIDKLLSPISLTEPAGTSLRYDPIYDRIRELRREDDATLPQGVWKSDQKRADWKTVESLCVETIETRSKDLQVSAWLLEAWLHLHGFAGAAEGLRVMLAMCESFWDGLYPLLEGGDSEFRIAPIVWLNRKLPPDLKQVPLTAPEADGAPVCTLADWETACQLESLQNRQGQQTPNNDRDMTLGRFQQSAMLTPTTFLAGKLEEVRALLHASADLQALLDSKLGAEAPGLLAVRNAGEGAATLLESLLRDRGALRPVEGSGVDQEIFQYHYPEQEMTDPTDPGNTTSIQTRAEAYRMLAEAADFLIRTEPHSPTPYLVRRAILWGSMTLEELLPELVRNQSELSDIYRLLNVRLREDGNRK